MATQYEWYNLPPGLTGEQIEASMTKDNYFVIIGERRERTMTDSIYSDIDTDQAIIDQWNAWFNSLPEDQQKKVLDWFVEKLVRRIAETLVKAHEKNFENFSETPLQGQIPMV